MPGHAGDGVEEAVGEGGVGGVPDTVGRGIEDQPDGAVYTPGFFCMCGGNGIDVQVTDLDRRFPSPSVAGWASVTRLAMPPAW